MIHKEFHWAVPNAHNGFLDVTLQLGLLGSPVPRDLGVAIPLARRLALPFRNKLLI